MIIVDNNRPRINGRWVTTPVISIDRISVENGKITARIEFSDGSWVEDEISTSGFIVLKNKVTVPVFEQDKGMLHRLGKKVADFIPCGSCGS